MDLKRLIVLSILMVCSSLFTFNTSAFALTQPSKPVAALEAIAGDNIKPSAAKTPDETGVVATYHGEQLNLADGWQDAQICAEFDSGDVRCFADDAELAEALAEAPSSALEPGATVVPEAALARSAHSCPSGYACLWEHANYGGRRLQWKDKGQKNLADWGFRDQASSAYNNRRLYGFSIQDFRTGMPDPKIILPRGSAYSNFTTIKYLHGGNWNDKADAVVLH